MRRRDRERSHGEEAADGWSPQGAHRVAVVRAAVLDGRFSEMPVRLALAALTDQDFLTFVLTYERATNLHTVKA